jgi:hypothetical protein
VKTFVADACIAIKRVVEEGSGDDRRKMGAGARAETELRFRRGKKAK